MPLTAGGQKPILSNLIQEAEIGYPAHCFSGPHVQPILSIVLPCYQEAQSIPEILERFRDSGSGRDFKLILVNNGSTDNTAQVLAERMPRYPFARCVEIQPNQGYGNGIFAGLKAARGTVLAWSHADLQTDPADVFRALDLYCAAHEQERLLVKGRRRGRGLSEWCVSRGMEIAAWLLLRTRLREINAQPKLFHRDLLQRLVSPPKDFNFDTYVLYESRRHGWRFATIDVQFPPRRHGLSHWASNWRSKIRHILGSLRFMFRLGAGRWS